MLKLHQLILLVMLVYSVEGQTPDNTLRPVTDENPTCQEFTANICTSVGYNMAFFPNFRQHETESQAVGELSDFIPLINSGCSNAILYLLCGYYLPFCLPLPSTGEPVVLNPCRNLCEYVRSTCEDELQALGYVWPSHLNCSLDTFHELPQCFGPPNPSTVVLPTVMFTPLPSSTQTDTPVPSTSPPSVTPTPPPATPTMTDATDRATQPGGGASYLQPSILLVAMATIVVLNMLRYNVM